MQAFERGVAVTGGQVNSRDGLAIKASDWDEPLRWVLRCMGVFNSLLAVGLCTGEWVWAGLISVLMVVFGAACKVAEVKAAQSTGADQQTWRRILQSTAFVAVLAGPLFALLCLYHGGETGRIVALIILINAVLSIILNSAFNRGAWAGPALLPVAFLLATPFFSVSASVAPAWAQTAAVFLTTIGLLTSFFQAFKDQRSTIAEMRRAMEAAEAGRLAAEAGQAKAESAARGKADFMVMMSHELRTPLNAVIGYSEMLYEDLLAEGHNSVAEDSKRINEAGRQLLDMVEQVFDLTDSDHGQMCVHPTNVNFTDLALDAARSARAQARVNANTFKLIIDENIGEGVSDAGKIRQCLAHLLSNACKFTSSGEITLEVRRCADDRTVEFSVTDTGVGIALEKIAELFTPFYQGEAGFSRSFGGAGLGLAHARRLALAIGGDITVESAIGIGSAFALRVPCEHFRLQETASAA